MATSLRILLVAGFLADGLLSAPNARATTWNVPADAATIQAGLGLAAPGDTVEVEPGTYSGPGNHDLDFAGKDLVLRSVGGAPVTILDCQASGRGLAFQNCEGNAAVVEGFTITNGRVARGGAIVCNGSSPTIRDCVLIANRADETGGAVSCQFDAAPRLERCRLEGNNAFLSGGGMALINASAEITDCILTGNSAGILGGGIYLREASPTITGTLVADNRSNGAGGGLVIYHLSAPVITRCVIQGNRAGGSAGAAFCDDMASPTFVDCLVTGNHSEFSGGGILCTNRSSALIQGSTLSGNQALQAGGGLYAEAFSTFTLERSILWGNCSAADAEAHLADAPSQALFTCCDVDSSGIGGAGAPGFVADNVFADPLFCSPLPCVAVPLVGGDYGLSAASPGLPQASPCGQRIGALVKDCGVTDVPGDAPAADRPGALSCSPSPFRDQVRIQYRLPGIGPLHLAVYSPSGRLIRAFDLDADTGSLFWDGQDRTGRPASPGVYFVRVAREGSQQVGRVEKIR